MKVRGMSFNSNARKSKMNTYKKAVWLNDNKSASTGSVVAFYGYNPGFGNIDGFLEVGSCSKKARLHMDIDKNVDKTKARKDFIKKIRKLEKVCKEYADFLEKLS